MNENFEKIKKKVHQHSIHITDVPKETKTRFKEIAEKEFSNHYGWTLKWLIDFRDGILSSPNQNLSDKIDLLADEIANIKQTFDKPKEKKAKIKTLSGKILKMEE